jgi:hypothetical protein
MQVREGEKRVDSCCFRRLCLVGPLASRCMEAPYPFHQRRDNTKPKPLSRAWRQSACSSAISSCCHARCMHSLICICPGPQARWPSGRWWPGSSACINQWRVHARRVIRVGVSGRLMHEWQHVRVGVSTNGTRGQGQWRRAGLILIYYLYTVKRSHHVRREGLEIPTLI